jgi:hypothetical protein
VLFFICSDAPSYDGGSNIANYNLQMKGAVNVEDGKVIRIFKNFLRSLLLDKHAPPPQPPWFTTCIYLYGILQGYTYEITIQIWFGTMLIKTAWISQVEFTGTLSIYSSFKFQIPKGIIKDRLRL